MNPRDSRNQDFKNFRIQRVWLGSVKFQGIHGSAGSPETDLSNVAFSTLSNVPESTESCRFEIRGFDGSSDPFSSRMSALVSFFFQMGPNASGAHQS